MDKANRAGARTGTGTGTDTGAHRANRGGGDEEILADGKRWTRKEQARDRGAGGVEQQVVQWFNDLEGRLEGRVGRRDGT